MLSVTAGRDTIIYGAKGTMIHFYTNSFKDGNGNIINSGIVDLQLTEMYKPGDMISNRATTFSNGQILLSGGEVNIVATMKGQTVYARNYGLGFIHSSGSGTSMALFYGGSGNQDSITTWTVGDTAHNGTIAAGTRVDSSTSNNTPRYVFDSCTNFVMVNCDCYMNNDSPLTSVTVVLPDTTFNPYNTQIYLVLHNVNPWGVYSDTTVAVLASDNQWGCAYNKSTNTFSLYSGGTKNIVPAGQAYELVVVTSKNIVWYYYQQSGRIPHNGLVTIANMAQTVYNDLKTNLDAL